MSVLDQIKFYFFHHHHYIDVPPDEASYPATWVVPPSRLFDPEKGHALYQRHLRYMRLADDLGFDGICINEHHNTLYSMTPAVSLMGAAIATHTTRAKIMVAGVSRGGGGFIPTAESTFQTGDWLAVIMAKDGMDLLDEIMLPPAGEHH